MSYLIGQVAQPMQAYPESQTMPDVIDALKRLERIGSENSKTTEKLISAAKQLAEKIVEQYGPGLGEAVSIVEFIQESGSSIEDEFQVRRFKYEIRSGRLYNAGSYEFVDEGRDAVLRFSKDIAEGLLDPIIDNLVKYQEVSRRALSVIDLAPRPSQGASVEGHLTCLEDTGAGVSRGSIAVMFAPLSGDGAFATRYSCKNREALEAFLNQNLLIQAKTAGILSQLEAEHSAHVVATLSAQSVEQYFAK